MSPYPFGIQPLSAVIKAGTSHFANPTSLYRCIPAYAARTQWGFRMLDSSCWLLWFRSARGSDKALWSLQILLVLGELHSAWASTTFGLARFNHLSRQMIHRFQIGCSGAIAAPHRQEFAPCHREASASASEILISRASAVFVGHFRMASDSSHPWRDQFWTIINRRTFARNLLTWYLSWFAIFCQGCLHSRFLTCTCACLVPWEVILSLQHHQHWKMSLRYCIKNKTVIVKGEAINKVIGRVLHRRLTFLHLGVQHRGKDFGGRG